MNAIGLVYLQATKQTKKKLHFDNLSTLLITKSPNPILHLIDNLSILLIAQFPSPLTQFPSLLIQCVLTELLHQTTLMQEIDLQEWKNTYSRVHNTIKAQQIIKYNNLIKKYFAQEQQQKNHINKEEKEKIQNHYINILFDKFFNRIEKENLLKIEEQYNKTQSNNMYNYRYLLSAKLNDNFNNKNTQRFILKKFDENIKKYKQTKDVPMEKIEEKTQ